MTRRTAPDGEISRDEYAATMSEDQMLATIVDLVAVLGGRAWHVRDSRRSPEMTDCPDLVIVLPGIVAVLELKSQKRRVTPGQESVFRIVRSAALDGTGWVTGLATIVRPIPKNEYEIAFTDLLDVLAEFEPDAIPPTLR